VFGFTPGESTQLSGVQHGGVLAGMLLARRRPARWRPAGHVALARCAAGRSAAAWPRRWRWRPGGRAAVGPAWPLRANVFALGVANGAFSIAAIGSMMALAGQGRAAREGTRMGLWGAAQAIAFGVGGLVGTAASDLARWLIGRRRAAYASVFALEALLFVVAAAAGLARIGRMRAGRHPAPAAAVRLPPVLPTPFGRSMRNMVNASELQTFDVVVVGGGPAGATAATSWRSAAGQVLLLDRAGRIKPCGGAIPPRLIKDFAIPDHLLVARMRTSRAHGVAHRPQGGHPDRRRLRRHGRPRPLRRVAARARRRGAAAPARTGTLRAAERDDDGT
jgi:MFS family permease